MKRAGLKNKLEAVILANEFPGDHKPWVKACSDFADQINCRVVKLMNDDWHRQVKKQHCDILLLKPGGISSKKRQAYVDRVCALHQTSGISVFPSIEEILIYEDKRYFGNWCRENNIPTPATHIINDYDSAVEFAGKTEYPFVAKTAIGASGAGVRLISSNSEAVVYINDAFSGRGIRRRAGPDLNKTGIIRRASKYLFSPKEIGRKVFLYFQRAKERQTGFVIFQEYIPHDFEWRVVRIGESFFAHKKLVNNGKASGSLLKSYEDPPLDLLSFVKEITDRHKFFSQAVDIFETPRGYLINEMQCIFGQSDPYQMKVGGVPGRYLFRDGSWVFEEGDFAKNQCYNLRVEWVIKMLR